MINSYIVLDSLQTIDFRSYALTKKLIHILWRWLIPSWARVSIILLSATVVST